MTRSTRTESDPVDLTEFAGGTEAAAVATLAQRLKPVHIETFDDAGGDPLVAKVYGHATDGETKVLETIDLEKYRDHPRSPTGTVQVHTQQGLVTVAKRQLSASRSTLWGDVEAAKLTVVLNDHKDHQEEAASTEAGWADHRIELALKPSPEWTAWAGHNERPHTQEDFGYFLEERLRDVIEPDGSTLLEVARTFEAQVGASFRRTHEAQSDTISLSWQEEVDAKAGKSGTLEIPSTFKVRLRPFLGCAPIDVDGLFTFRVRAGELSLGYRLLNLDDHKRDAVEQVLRWVGTELGLVAVEGVAPGARR